MRTLLWRHLQASPRLELSRRSEEASKALGQFETIPTVSSTASVTASGKVPGRVRIQSQNTESEYRERTCLNSNMYLKR